jgi:hypothetical protein
MKKLILTVLMVVMLAVPCMAEMEPEGLFTVEGTFWNFFMLDFETEETAYDLGFSGGIMYLCGRTTGRCFDSSDPPFWTTYDDNFLFTSFDSWIASLPGWWETLDGILIPVLGIGFGSFKLFVLEKVEFSLPAVYIKTSDNWTPPSE